MKVLTSRFIAFSDCGNNQPSHGVYSQAGWEILRDKAHPLSLHWNYDAAVDAAARDEVVGHPRVVICFDHSTFNVRVLEKQGGRQPVAKMSEADDSPRHGPEF